jgi:hypothetical protein
MQAELVEQARVIGVAMGSRIRGAVIGWTTDGAKAEACREAGLAVMAGYNRTGPSGWEILALPDPPPEGEDTHPTKGQAV